MVADADAVAVATDEAGAGVAITSIGPIGANSIKGSTPMPFLVGEMALLFLSFFAFLSVMLGSTPGTSSSVMRAEIALATSTIETLRHGPPFSATAIVP